MTQPVEFLSSVGRIVWGHPLNSQPKKDQRTKQPIIRDGKPVEQWVFGLAIPKEHFAANEWSNLNRAASMLFPNGVPNGFSWKYKDGDGVDKKGKPYNQREGWGGHYILTISTEAFAPQVYKREGNGFRQLEAHEIKTGDFVRVMINAKANAPQDSTHTPGVFINPKGIELVGYGTEIISGGIDPDEVFASPVAQLPPGASATPIASGAMVPPGMTTAPAGYAPQPQQMAPMGNVPVAQGIPQSMPPAGMAAVGNPYPMNNSQIAQPNAYPSNGLPAPATDFVQNIGYAPQPQQMAPMGNVPVAPTAGQPTQMPYPSQQAGYAPGATGYPTNVPPGIPQR